MLTVVAAEVMCLAPDRSLAREDVKGGVLKFDFGPGKAAPGYTRVLSTTVYTKNLGYGFEAGTQIKGVDRGGKDALRGDFCTSERPFFFSVALPEGNYNVTVILGDAAGERVTTVKAELLITIHE